MITRNKLPEVGTWYTASGIDDFEVVAFDADAEAIELQYADGSVEELDLETWLELNAVSIGQSGRWSGGLDVAPEDGAEEQGTAPRRSTYLPGDS